MAFAATGEPSQIEHDQALVFVGLITLVMGIALGTGAAAIIEGRRSQMRLAALSHHLSEFEERAHAQQVQDMTDCAVEAPARGRPPIEPSPQTSRSSNDYLADQVKNQSKQIARARLTEQRLTGLLRQSVTNYERQLAHIDVEIRVPTTSIRSLSDFILQTPLSPEQRRYAECIRQATENMLDTIISTMAVDPTANPQDDLLTIEELVRNIFSQYRFRAMNLEIDEKHPHGDERSFDIEIDSESLEASRGPIQSNIRGTLIGVLSIALSQSFRVSKFKLSVRAEKQVLHCDFLGLELEPESEAYQTIESLLSPFLATRVNVVHGSGGVTRTTIELPIAKVQRSQDLVVHAGEPDKTSPEEAALSWPTARRVLVVDANAFSRRQIIRALDQLECRSDSITSLQNIDRVAKTYDLVIHPERNGDREGYLVVETTGAGRPRAERWLPAPLQAGALAKLIERWPSDNDTFVGQQLSAPKRVA